MMFPKKKRIVDENLLSEIRTMPSAACGYHLSVDPHHVKTVKTGGDDVEENIIPLCRNHHTMVHRQGLEYMAQNFQGVTSWLDRNGWTYDDYRLKWVRY
jgi:hypothetical protein